MRYGTTLFVLLLAGSLTAAPTVTFFRVPGVFSVTPGPDGNLWMATEDGIAKMTTNGLVTTYPTPGGLIVAGSDGRMWFAVDNRVGAITTTGVVTEYSLSAGVHPTALTLGADGNLWFGYEGGMGKITTAGAVTYYAITTPEIRPVIDAEAGPDGNVWFVRFPLARIERITPGGVVTHFDLPLHPTSIARGGDGGLWLAFHEGRAIARISVGGTIELISPVGGGSDPGRPNAVYSGPGAGIWFTTFASSQIGRIMTDGEVELIDFHDSRSDISYSSGLAPGPDGNLWAIVSQVCVCCLPECPPPAEPPISVARVNLAASHDAHIPTLSESALAIFAVALACSAIVILKIRSV